jgi:hypothetical protein
MDRKICLIQHQNQGLQFRFSRKLRLTFLFTLFFRYQLDFKFLLLFFIFLLFVVRKNSPLYQFL